MTTHGSRSDIQVPHLARGTLPAHSLRKCQHIGSQPLLLLQRVHPRTGCLDLDTELFNLVRDLGICGVNHITSKKVGIVTGD